MTTSQPYSSEQPLLPGRLGDPARVLKTDPRADPRLVAALAPFALDVAPPPAPVTADSPLHDKLAYSAANEAGMEAVFTALFADLPAVTNVERRTEVIKGVDGNDITLYIHTPKNASGPLPCVYHTHGGGMVVLMAAGPTYVRWRDELAAQGLVVVGVEFRNGAGKLGNHPFPAGLNDCMSGLQWTFDHKATLGISKIITSGESGGGNLSLAVCLKAKRDDRLAQINGVYALCPYIYGAWARKGKELPSLYENNDYLINCGLMEVFASVYDPENRNATNPLCWPYWATREDLQGLPPHVISVNELDPLRDEGLKYYQKLLAAGVRGYSRTVNGTCHAGDVLLRKAIPDVYAATVRDIKGFADSL
ncbi:MAG TPA: alpha/beta hydrolase fold domain-containing protein [Candidatus Binatia bacterium]|nr:alpha/beta hydrolase fold domain-containing protein [Candidatus Binatia bacterium]